MLYTWPHSGCDVNHSLFKVLLTCCNIVRVCKGGHICIMTSSESQQDFLHKNLRLISAPQYTLKKKQE